MPDYYSKEALAALVESDLGMREFLSKLPEAERARVGRVLDSPELLKDLLVLLPPEERSLTQSLLDDLFSGPDKAMELYRQCRFHEAREHLKRANERLTLPPGLPADAIVKAAEFSAQRAKAFNHDLLGDVEKTLGNTRLAGEHHHMALLLARECGDRDTEAKALYGLGCYYWEIGDYEQAFEHSRLALELIGDGPDQYSVKCKVYNNLNLIYAELAQWDKAEEYGEKALAVAEESQDLNMLPTILNNWAMQLMEQRRLEEIEPLLEHGLSVVVEMGDPRQEALIRRNLGMFYLNCDTTDENIDAAIVQFRKSLEISRRIGAIGLEAMACSGMGHAMVMQGDPNSAEVEFRRAVDICRDIGAVADCAELLVNLGNLLRYCHQKPEEALAYYDEAITKTEQIRAKLKRETHRIGLTETRIEPYQQTITTLLELGRADDAFHYLERARSKALLEMLAGQFMVENDDGPFREAAELALRIDELRHALDEIRRVDETGGPEETEGVNSRTTIRSELQQGLEEEEEQFARLCEELQRISPERHGIVAIQATDSASVRALLPQDTALLELYQTEEQLLLFVIRPAHEVKVAEVELPAEEAVEIIFPFVMALCDSATFDIRSHDYIRSVRKPASWLHDTVFTQIEGFLEGVKRLVIVPHIFWHYLPFHALYDNEKRQYLLDRFEVSYAPSASVLEICCGKKRHRRDSALILCRNDGDLPHVEMEGSAIDKVFDHAAVYHGSEATLDQIAHQTSPDVIHCACHGYFDPTQPFLSGIAIPPNRSEDRPTLLIDLLRLRMESSLVTLSACDTGLNTVSNADELVGLSRGFFGAGAAALLLSLWKVADSSTAYLMENFYWHYVVNRQTKGRALQLAMQAVRAKPEYAHPYYWAPFVVMGDWG